MASPPLLSHSLSPTDLSIQLSAAQNENDPVDSVVLDFAALVRALNKKEVDKLKALIDERDKKEVEAAAKHFALVKERRVKKKLEVESLKKSRWNLRNQGQFNAKVSKEAVENEIDAELGHPTLPQCYEEIKRLLAIEKNPICAKALQEWSRKEMLFTSRVERKKSKVADLKNEIYQLIGFFSVFQGVLLTAVSQSNLLHCNNLWSPIVLSAVASVVTIFGVIQKLRQIESFQNTIHSEEQSSKEMAARLNTLRNKGAEDFEFAKYEHREDKKQETTRFFIYFSLVVGSLIVFTVGFPISHWRILCYPGCSP